VNDGAAPRLLLVDDEEDVLELLAAVFEREGFRTTVARDGKSALSLAYDEIPDAILLDIMMPEMDGWEVLRALKADERTRRIPVAILSARTEARDKIIGLQEGAVCYLEKPFSTALVVHEIRNLLGKGA